MLIHLNFFLFSAGQSPPAAYPHGGASQDKRRQPGCHAGKAGKVLPRLPPHRPGVGRDCGRREAIQDCRGRGGCH